MNEEQSPIRFGSDGIEIELSDGRTVQPVLKDERRMSATKIHPIDEYAKYEEEVDCGNRVYIWFEEI